MNFVLELFLKMMKFMCKKELFQSLAMKNEFHIKFKDKNNIFAKKKIETHVIRIRR